MPHERLGRTWAGWRNRSRRQSALQVEPAMGDVGHPGECDAPNVARSPGLTSRHTKLHVPHLGRHLD